MTFKPQLSGLEGSSLLELHNELTGKSIKRFADRKAGERQTLKALQANKFTSYDAYLLHKNRGMAEAAAEVQAAALKEKHAPRAEAAKETWLDPSVKEARTSRANVHVACDELSVSNDYRSVAQAFQELDLPMGIHIKFRAMLKANAKMTLKHKEHTYNFTTKV